MRRSGGDLGGWTWDGVDSDLAKENKKEQGEIVSISLASPTYLPSYLFTRNVGG